MTISMRFIGCALFFVVTCTSARFGQTASFELDSLEAELVGKSYEIALPLPFGHSEISIKFDGQKIDSMKIVTETVKVDVHSELLGDLEMFGEPGFSFPVIRDPTTDQIDRFRITFETGELYEVVMCDCGSPNNSCVDHVRDIVIFTINSKGHVEREILDVGSILERADQAIGDSCDSDGK